MQYLKSLIFLNLFLVPVFGAGVGSFDNSTSCDKAKQSKLLANCCNIPRDDRISKACRKSLMSQTKKTTNNGETRNLKSDKVALHACIAECIFQKNGYLLANGTLNLPVIQKSYEQRYRNDAAMGQLIIKSLNSCADSSKSRSKQFEWLHTKDDCDYYPATLLACTMEQVYKNCPTNRWKNSDDCVAMRKC